MLLDYIGKRPLFLDGGMGTLLQAEGLAPGELPETWNVLHPEIVTGIHERYFRAGSDMVLVNTFGANRIKFHEEAFSLEEIINAAVKNARNGALKGISDGRCGYVGLDIGPTGKLLEPVGDLEFEEAYAAFAEMVRLGVNAGVDFIHIETMSDTYEMKAAVLAAKENSELPVFATMIFDEYGKLLTGGDVPSMVALLEGLRVDALGFNCGLGPKQMHVLLKELTEYTSLPIIVKPNAGLPKQKDGQTYYDVEPDAFAIEMKEMIADGACILGGCCGTTPEHIKALVQWCKDQKVKLPEYKDRTLVASYGKAVEIGEVPIMIGERINPTGKKLLKQALKERDFDYILKEAVLEQDHGAHILDVNVGLPDIDEAEMMKAVVQKLQSITSLPLQIDTVNPRAMGEAMRIYNGKPMVNSVSGKRETMEAVFPLVRTYGGVVVGLTLDEDGIPETAEGRAAIAGKIIEAAASYGIQKKDIVIDVLAMTISSEPESARTALKALRLVKERYGVKTVLGVSNISFGLPNRPVINSNFYTLALYNGLNAGIVNPLSEAMMQAYHSYMALMNFDHNCEQFIERYGKDVKAQKTVDVKEISLFDAILKGLKEEAGYAAKELLQKEEPLEIIKAHLVPALDRVGQGFENGTVFLPQLLMSAESAKEAFTVLKEQMLSGETGQEKKEKVILATVKGDIHDIGKNIVKVLLENYNFEVIDLGKDVSPEQITACAVEEDVRIVGLSALMTTTVESMEQTIKLLHETKPDCRIMVGGAVLNQDYADRIGADFYGKDAMQSVYFAQKVLREN